jgi:hypothetical protein
METIDHLLLQCVYAWEVWFKALRRGGWQQCCPTRSNRINSWWMTAWKVVVKLHRKAFDSLVLLTAWTIWNHRNGNIFRNGFKPLHLLVNYI